MKTQNDQVLDFMKQNGGITAMNAYEKLKITRLSARIYDLRKAGVEIEKERVSYISQDGIAKHYDIFRLAKKE